jgi:hypothetical protein
MYSINKLFCSRLLFDSLCLAFDFSLWSGIGNWNAGQSVSESLHCTLNMLKCPWERTAMKTVSKGEKKGQRLTPLHVATRGIH